MSEATMTAPTDPLPIEPLEVIAALYQALAFLTVQWADGSLQTGIHGDTDVTGEVGPALALLDAWLQQAGGPSREELADRSVVTRNA
jgi:hypothetical protein